MEGASVRGVWMNVALLLSKADFPLQIVVQLESQ